MAFTILNEEQIALLTENQKQQYEKELDIYKERNAFVERMHVLENAELLPYEPKLRNIIVAGEAPEIDFGRQEYAVKICTPVTKPELQFRAPEFREPISAVLPECSGIENITIGSIKKIETVQPKLPESKKAVPIIPKQMPQIPKTSSPDMPDKMVLDAPNLSFTEPQMVEPFLPEVAVSITEAKPIHKVENPQINLPAALKPNIAVEVKKVEAVYAVLPELAKIEPLSADFEKPEISAVELRPVAKIEPLDTEFIKPEIQKAEMPTVLKTEPVNADFKKPEISAAELRPIVKIEPVYAKFEKPEISISELPRVSKPDIAARDIAPLEHSSVSLPAFRKINIADIEIKPVERQEIQISVAPITITEVKSFAGIESKVEGLPNKASVHIPNAYEALRELLPLIKNSEALGEVIS